MNKLPFFLLTLLFLAACNPEKDAPKLNELSSEEAIMAMEDMSDDASQDVIDLMNSDGFESIFDLLNFMFESDEFGNNLRADKYSTKEKALEIVRIFARSPAARVSTDESEEFPTGIYEWNAQLEDFELVEESDDLILKFPIGESETNNAIFTLSDLEFNVDDLPSKIVANLEVDEITMVDLHYVVNWSSKEFPEVADIYLFVNPFTFDLNFNAQGETVTLVFTIANGDETIAAIDLEASGSIDDEVLPVVEGSVEYRGVKIAGRVDLDGLDNAMFNETDPNEEMELELFIEDEKAGDIVLVLETNDEYTDYVPYVVFSDGTQEPLEELLDSIFSTVEDELEALEI